MCLNVQNNAFVLVKMQYQVQRFWEEQMKIGEFSTYIVIYKASN